MIWGRVTQQVVPCVTPLHITHVQQKRVCTMSPVLAHLVCAAVIKGQHKTYGVFVA